MKKIQEMSASELIALLTDVQKDELYRMLWSDHVREDVEAAMKDYSGSLPENEDEKEDIVESVVNAYVYDGRYDCNLSYWDNINNIIQFYVQKIRYKAIDIMWDIDYADEGILPKEVLIPKDMLHEEEISNWLSETYGYCHQGFSLARV